MASGEKTAYGKTWSVCSSEVSKSLDATDGTLRWEPVRGKMRKMCVRLSVLVAFLCPTLVLASSILGSDLATFAVLGASGVTNVATSTIGGNLGSAPNASIGGGYVFTAGSSQANTALAQSAQIQLDAAILAVNALGPGLTIGADLTGVILPGVYTVPAAGTNLSGALILDGQGNSNAQWAFLFPSTLITSTTSNVFVTNVGSGSDVGLYWSVGTAATLNGPTFAGNVLANQLISSDGNLTMGCGRLLSAESQVTLNQDNISTGCDIAGTPGFGSGGFNQGGSEGTTVPEPTSSVLVVIGLIGMVAWKRRRKLCPV